MLEAVGEVFPEAKYQRCTVHFYRNVFSVTPRSKVKLVAIGWVLAALPLRAIASPCGEDTQGTPRSGEQKSYQRKG